MKPVYLFYLKNNLIVILKTIQIYQFIILMNLLFILFDLDKFLLYNLTKFWGVVQW